MGPNRSGMPLEHSQTLLGHFRKNSFPVDKLGNYLKKHETSSGRKLICFLINYTNEKKNAHLQLKIWRPDEVTVFHMKAIREQMCFVQHKKTFILHVIVVHAQ